MRKYIFFIIFGIIFALLSCNNAEHKVSKNPNYNSHIPINSPYLYFFDMNSLMFSYITINNLSEGKLYNKVVKRNVGRETMISNFSKISVSDTFLMPEPINTQNAKVCLKRHFIISQLDSIGVSDTLSANGNVAEADRNIDFEIRQPIPIQLISPYIEQCSTIPYCYYSQMQIEWNPDFENENGIIIIAAWQGTMLEGNSYQQQKYHFKWVEDNGITTLEDDIFDGIPEGALTTLILIRASILHVIIDNSEYEWWNVENANDFILFDDMSYWETWHNVYNIALSSMTMFRFILIRQLP